MIKKLSPATELLTPEEISKAATWAAQHRRRVSKLIKSEILLYPPDEREYGHPELWAAPHWRWFTAENLLITSLEKTIKKLEKDTPQNAKAKKNLEEMVRAVDLPTEDKERILRSLQKEPAKGSWSAPSYWGMIVMLIGWQLLIGAIIIQGVQGTNLWEEITLGWAASLAGLLLFVGIPPTRKRSKTLLAFCIGATFVVAFVGHQSVHEVKARSIATLTQIARFAIKDGSIQVGDTPSELLNETSLKPYGVHDKGLRSMIASTTSIRWVGNQPYIEPK